MLPAAKRGPAEALVAGRFGFPQIANCFVFKACQQRFAGALTRKTGTIDPVTRTELWEYDVDNRQQFLKAGAFVYARLNLERGTPSMILPPTAIATTLERKFVIRVHNGVAQWVDVRQGMTTDNGVEVFGDVHPGDTLLTKATDERKPGATAYWKLNH